MLKQRVITGVILVAVVLAFLFWLSPAWFMGGTVALVLLAAWEWATLASIERPVSKLIFMVMILVCLWLSLFLPLIPTLAISAVWWLCALVLVLCYPGAKFLWQSREVRIILGILVLIPFWLAINVLRTSVTHGAILILFLFCLVWAADTGAYFAGRWWGSVKLMPKVSPGKTWQGFFGGLLLSLLVGVIGLSWLKIDFSEWWAVLLMITLLNIFTVVGDLFESMLKRHCQMKDSGSILPGHGGILDRIDSLVAATPLFLLGFLLLHQLA